MDGHSGDPYALQRFVDAQGRVYDQVCSELRQGLKMTHWIWFIFPQIYGFSSSATSRKFAISSLEEAAAYLDHPILGPRLRQCTKLVTQTSNRTIKQILGFTDSLKFRSSMTLFAHATTQNQVFEGAVRKYFESGYDEWTLERL